MLGLLVVAMLTGGCTVTIGSDDDDGPTTPEPRATGFVEDERATLDLREPPTREELGFAEGRSSALYDRAAGSDGIRVRVLMPDGGETELLAFSLSSTSLGDPLDAPDDPGTAPPSETVVNVRHESVEDAEAALREQADALSIPAEEIDYAFAATDPGAIAGTVVRGYRKDWLALELEVRTGEDPDEVVLNYMFNYAAENLPKVP
jgi:hypothetical protein